VPKQGRLADAGWALYVHDHLDALVRHGPQRIAQLRHLVEPPDKGHAGRPTEDWRRDSTLDSFCRVGAETPKRLFHRRPTLRFGPEEIECERGELGK